MMHLTAVKLVACNAGKILLPVMLLFMAANAHGEPDIASPERVKHCRFIERVEGGSGYGKHFEWRRQAQHSASLQAAKLHASHLVWEQFYPIGVFNGKVVAKAYDCRS